MGRAILSVRVVVIVVLSVTVALSVIVLRASDVALDVDDDSENASSDGGDEVRRMQLMSKSKQ